MKLKDQLLTVSAAYCAACEVSEARMSTIIYGQGNRIPRLREGKDMLSGNVEFGLQWFSDNWPDSRAKWPDNVSRPDPSSRSAAFVRSSLAPAP